MCEEASWVGGEHVKMMVQEASAASHGISAMFCSGRGHCLHGKEVQRGCHWTMAMRRLLPGLAFVPNIPHCEDEHAVQHAVGLVVAGMILRASHLTHTCPEMGMACLADETVMFLSLSMKVRQGHQRFM